MRVRLLGPVDILTNDVPQQLSGMRRKAVLATLALHGSEVVSAARLAEIVWGAEAPPGAANTLQSHVSHLRTVLGDRGAIVSRPPGYLLSIGADGTDVQVAERLLRESTQAADPEHAVVLLRQAQELWRGRPLADVTGVAWLEEQAGRLDVLWGQVQRALADARLTAGDHAALIPDLERMAAEEPLDEQVHAQLMLALYRSGRQADALAVARRIRQTLADELGVEPSQSLRDLETAILRQDQELDPFPQPSAAAAPGQELDPAQPDAARAPAPPAQLPMAPAAFAGREAELARLDAALAASDRAGTTTISMVSGTAGVGKTALAVHWAHRVAERFPDGQLYVNLRGFDPAGAALDPNSAVRDFLEALGMLPGRVPDGLEARTGQYRSMLAGKRVLVVLDNARDAEQVRPLLPGTPGCVAIVTSRNQLAGLVAVEGACPVTVDLLTVAEARDLLARRLGTARIAAEPDAADEIIARCARLPLALAIAAARAATRPEFPLAFAATELHEAGRLDAFDGDDLATNVRAAFSWSLRGLSEDAARLFRLLGLHPGPDISVPAAASLAGIEAGHARLALAELTRAHLLAEHVPGRFALHDLLRAYAAELAVGCDGEDARAAAVRRVLDHYLRTSQHAASVLEPYLNPIVMPPAAAGAIAQQPAVLADALAWFDNERAIMLRAVQLAADAGLTTHAWQLAWNVSSYLHRRHLLHDQELACTIALDAARRGADAAGEGRCLHRLACSHAKAGRSDEATRLFRQSLQRYGTAGDHSGQACVHGNMFWVAAREKRNDEAMRHALRAQELFLAAGNRAGQVRVLADIAFCQAADGDYQRALGNCERALAELGELGEPRYADSIWDTLGFVHLGLGHYQQALDAYRRTAQMCREAGDRFNEGTTLETIGDVLAETGDAGAARRSWAQALRILDEIGHPDADDVRRKLGRR